MRWSWHIVCMGTKRVLAGKLKGKGWPGRCKQK
jgi:hypothetical protein